MLLAEHGDAGGARRGDAAQQPDRLRHAGQTRWCSCCRAIRSRRCAPTTSSPAGPSARWAAGRRRGRTLGPRHAGAQDQLADRPPGLRPRAAGARPRGAAVGVRRLAAVVHDQGRRLRDRGRRQRRLPRRRRRGRLAAIAAEQEQFLQVLDRDEAERRFRAALDLRRAASSTCALDEALGRVLAADVVSPVDVPSFDRSNVDGFAVVARGHLRRVGRGAAPRAPGRRGDSHRRRAGHGRAARRGRGHRHRRHDAARRRRGGDGGARRRAAAASCGSRRAVTAGSGVSFAGTDITAGETVLRRGQLLTSRDTGVLAAIGVADVDVWRRPVVAILSTGDEIIAPGAADAAGAGLRLERAGAGRRRARAGRRAAPPRHRRRRRRRAARSSCARRSPSPTWCCSRAAPARAPATCRTAWSPS